MLGAAIGEACSGAGFQILLGLTILLLGGSFLHRAMIPFRESSGFLEALSSALRHKPINVVYSLGLMVLGSLWLGVTILMNLPFPAKQEAPER
jgi:hypothetical protein